jgi:hypothetical protein
VPRSEPRSASRDVIVTVYQVGWATFTLVCDTHVRSRHVGGPRGGHDSELINGLPPPQFAVCAVKLADLMSDGAVTFYMLPALYCHLWP